jgi:hypothetical protein
MENGSGGLPPSYQMGSEDTLPGIKPRKADHSPLVPRLRMHGVIRDDQKVSVHLTITLQSSGAERLFDHPVPLLPYTSSCSGV